MKKMMKIHEVLALLITKLCKKNLQLKTFELIQGGLSSANSADQLRDSQSTPPRPLEISNKN